MKGAEKDDDVGSADLTKRENFTLEEFCEWARVSRATAYRAIKAKSLKAVKFGGRTLIRRADAEEFMRNLPAA